MAAETTAPTISSSPGGLAAVEQEIVRACKDARRERASVTLIAVSKTFGADAISPAIAAGQRVFGENRVQEAKAKWPGLMTAYPGIALHLIGPLQSNKAKEAVALFDAIHSVDRPSICEALAKEINSQDRRPELFVQTITGKNRKVRHRARGGDAFSKMREKYGLPVSAMCFPGQRGARAAFALTPNRPARIEKSFDCMSADFATAIQVGAHNVRVGRRFSGTVIVAPLPWTTCHANPTDTFPARQNRPRKNRPQNGRGGAGAANHQPLPVSHRWRNALASNVWRAGVTENILRDDEVLTAQGDHGAVPQQSARNYMSCGTSNDARGHFATVARAAPTNPQIASTESDRRCRCRPRPAPRMVRAPIVRQSAFMRRQSGSATRISVPAC